MGTITRGAKTAGGTSFSTGTIYADEVNTDFDTVFAEVNGNLSNANLSASAGIDPLKVDDASASATAQATVASPGNADAESLATTLVGEIQRLRYGVGRLAIGSTGSNVKRDDGTTKNVPWYERPVRGSNYVRNGSFEVQTGGAGTAPNGWTKEGTPSTLALVQAATMGESRCVQIVGSAADDGISQTFAGLAESALYFVKARVKVAAGTLRLVTSGADATSEFRDLDIETTSSDWTQINGIVATDSTPNNITLSFLAKANADDFRVDNVGFYRISHEIVDRPGYLSVSDISSSTGGTLDGTRRGFPNGDELTVSVWVPGPGYSIRATGYASFSDTAANTIGAVLVETQTHDGVPSSSDVAITAATCEANNGATAHLYYVNTTAVPGDKYTYTIECKAAAGATNNGTCNGLTLSSRVIVELIPPG